MEPITPDFAKILSSPGLACDLVPGPFFQAVLSGESDFSCLTKGYTIEDNKNMFENERKYDTGADETGDTLSFC